MKSRKKTNKNKSNETNRTDNNESNESTQTDNNSEANEAAATEKIESNENVREANFPDARSSALDYRWLAGCAIVTAIATFVRFVLLELKPLHHDEGVNGFFLVSLFRDGTYKYDPQNYHGPDLYYLALAFTKIFGLNTLSIRWSVAIFGVAIVVLTFFLRNYIGKIGSLAAALFLALSPGMVFISRYFIHEILFVFFSLGIVAGVLFFIEKRKAGIVAVVLMTLLLLVCFLPTALNLATQIGGENTTLLWIARLGLFAVEAALVFFIMRALLAWNRGRAIYLILASASAALLFATKETAFITIATMAIACGCVWLWRKIRQPTTDLSKLPKSELVEPAELTWRNFRAAAVGEKSDLSLLVFACAIIFAYVGVLFFSSFFTYPEGVWKAFEAYALWTKTGTKEHSQNGPWAYFKWGWKLESPILILSSIGTLIALAKARHRFAVFTSFWAFGLFAAYSLIPYKTPWLALSFLLPMCIVAGYGINELAAAKDVGLKIMAGILTVFAAAVLGYQTYDLNFVRYDDDSMPYIYAHTRRGFLDMIRKLEHYAEKSGKEKDSAIDIVSPEYWPMPWYMRDYPKAIFQGGLVDTTTSEMIVASSAQKADLNKRYGAHYRYAGIYQMRPGVDLILLVRSDLADADTTDLSNVANVPAP